MTLVLGEGRVEMTRSNRELQAHMTLSQKIRQRVVGSQVGLMSVLPTTHRESVPVHTARAHTHTPTHTHRAHTYHKHTRTKDTIKI